MPIIKGLAQSLPRFAKRTLEKYRSITHSAPRPNRLTGNRLLYALDPHRYQSQEPNWQDYRRLSKCQLPGDVRCWLLDSGSLTQHLLRASNGEFRVQIIDQRWGRARPSEVKLLGLRRHEYVLIREVLLICKQQPWVFARSILPGSSLTGRLRFLRHFDNKPLGQMIFNDPNMVRQPFEIAKVMSDGLALPNTIEPLKNYWGRRSRFELSGKPLMVSEIFLKHFDAQFNPIENLSSQS